MRSNPPWGGGGGGDAYNKSEVYGVYFLGVVPLCTPLPTYKPPHLKVQLQQYKSSSGIL